jgi:hypothetical protein
MMQVSSYYKVSQLADAKRDALTWLAGRLRWERKLDDLRLQSLDVDRKAA